MAVITALLLTTLAVTIVASLFWQQQVQVRSIENQRMQLQKQWILRGALDWARLILAESYRSSPANDNLQQAWAVGLAETRLDSYVENGRADGEAADATITGKIIDAQAYLNLAGLSQGGLVQPKAVAAFGRLLTQMRVDPELAVRAAASMAASQPQAGATGAAAIAGLQARAAATAATLATTTAVAPATAVAGNAANSADAAKAAASAIAATAGQMGITQIDDLLAVPGFTPEIVARLRNFVVILPKATPVNVNTAPAEVLAARIDTLSLQGAQALVASRDRAYFKDAADFQNRFAGQTLAPDAGDVAVRSDYFIIDGKVKLNRAGLEVLALIERTNAAGLGGAKILWIREN